MDDDHLRRITPQGGNPVAVEASGRINAPFVANHDNRPGCRGAQREEEAKAAGDIDMVLGMDFVNRGREKATGQPPVEVIRS